MGRPPLPPPAPDGNRWVTARQVAQFFGVSPDAVHRWAAAVPMACWRVA